MLPIDHDATQKRRSKGRGSIVGDKETDNLLLSSSPWRVILPDSAQSICNGELQIGSRNCRDDIRFQFFESFSTRVRCAIESDFDFEEGAVTTYERLLQGGKDKATLCREHLHQSRSGHPRLNAEHAFQAACHPIVVVRCALRNEYRHAPSAQNRCKPQQHLSSQQIDHSAL